MTITIYHNPRCSKSRQTLALLEDNNAQFKVVEYLQDTLGREELESILKKLKMSPRDLLRKKDASEAGLNDVSLSDDALITGMLENPIVIERPIVINGEKAIIGRPPENVLDII